MHSWSKILSTPKGIVVTVAVVVFGVELLSMALILWARPLVDLADSTWEFVDVATMIIIVTPVLYQLVFRKLTAKEAYLRQLTNTAQSAIVVVDEQCRIIDWNLAAEEMFLYGREEALGKQLYQLIIPPRFRAEVIKACTQFQQNGQGTMIGKNTEGIAIRKGGAEFPLEISISTVKVPGGWHAIGIIRDITERKRMELALYQAKETAEQALSEQRQLIAMISHEYRSPLAVIDSASQLLSLKLPAESEAAPIIARIRRGVSRLGNFLDNCLLEGRMDSDRLVLRNTKIDLYALAATLKDNTQLISEGHKFMTHLAPDLPPLYGDQQLIGIMLLNLLGNAIKYSPVASEVRLRISHSGQVYKFEVIDQGCGIPDDELPHIFQKYMRGRAVTSIPGAGLGLSLVAKIVGMHGGSVHMQSSTGKGSHATVTIPVRT